MPADDSLGQIIILNGTPRSGKSSIAAVIQDTFEGIWINLGVDHYMQMSPKRLHPSIGLRPGGEGPHLEEAIVRMYAGLYASIAAHSRVGLNVVSDVGHHDMYSQPRGILPACARRLEGLPTILVGVRCPIETIMERRRATNALPPDTSGDETVPAPVLRWQEQVHIPGIYDLQVDSSLLSPEACAQRIRAYLDSAQTPTAISTLAAMATDSSTWSETTIE